jgi:Sulfotransferase family
VPAARGPAAVRDGPAFMIVGTPRSGTTLVQRLACELPGVRVPPETHFLPLFVPGLLRRRRFPLAEAEIREELGCYAALSTSRGLGLDADGVVAALGGRCASPLALFGAIVATLAGPAEVHGEKTPNHLLWWRPLARALPALRLVAVVRDPRAVVASYRTTWDARDHRVLAERWRSDQAQLRAARAAVGGRLLVLRYEDVAADPAAARAALAAHVGAEARAGELVAPGRLGLPWEAWKAAAAGEVVPARRDGWRDALSAREAQEVLAIARRELAPFGYGPAPPLRTLALSPRRRLRFRVRRRAKLARFARLGRALA